MPKVELRQLKNRLSHYVRQVRAGREIQVTDRGEVVAELVPPRRDAIAWRMASSPRLMPP
jgi:prevent-host-death family protein